jgi:ubiquinone/menaquinone biosynthesis C-methylase UbiE
MSWKYTDEYYKNYTRETWDECAETYLPLMKQLLPYHKAVVDSIKPHPGEIVLDVCTGLGEPAMTMASIVAPGGQVIGIDLSSKMIQIARKTAEKRGLKNVKFEVMDAEKLTLPSNQIDVAVSCFGFQIVTDPDNAANEIFRVLKLGGRAGFTVWSTGDRVPMIDVLIAPMLEFAEPDETGYLPTPYELGGAGELTTMLETHGFSDTHEIRLNGTGVAGSVDEYLEMVLQGTPIGHSLSEESESMQKKIIEKAKLNISKYYTPGQGVRIPAECVIVSARKPKIAKDDSS